MENSAVIKLLTETERDLARKKNNALARGRWIVAHDCEMREVFCVELRAKIAVLDSADKEIRGEVS